MKCIIVEDQLPAQRILKKYIDDAGTLELVGTYIDALEAMPLLKTEKIDLMFLDIHLPKLSGIDFLKTLHNAPQVILTTAFQEYALEGYELDVVDYLLKPFSFQRFIKAISKVRIDRGTDAIKTEKEEANNLEEIYVKIGYDHVRIAIEDIVYIMSDSDYTEIYLSDKKYLSSESLRYWEEQLPQKRFVRIHKSYMINTSKIVKISGNRLFLENDRMVPIGRAYKNDFVSRYMN